MIIVTKKIELSKAKYRVILKFNFTHKKALADFMISNKFLRFLFHILFLCA